MLRTAARRCSQSVVLAVAGPVDDRVDGRKPLRSAPNMTAEKSIPSRQRAPWNTGRMTSDEELIRLYFLFRWASKADRRPDQPRRGLEAFSPGSNLPLESRAGRRA